MLGDGGPPAYFQVRVMICLTLFALWPFTRLVHAFTALIGYLFWPMSSTAAATSRQGWTVGSHPRRGVVTPASSHDSSPSQRGLRAGASRR